MSGLSKGAFAKAKSEHPLENYVEQVAGKPARKSGNKLFWLCPLPHHSERTPSFCVDVAKQTWRCYGKCNCGGDIFGFIEMLKFGTMSPPGSPTGYRNSEGKWVADHQHPKMQAYYELTRQQPTEVKRQAAPREKATPKNPITNEIAAGFARIGFGAWNEYFCLRGISRETATERMFGKRRNFYWKGIKLDGEELRFTCDRYTIPWFQGNKVVGLQQRLDERQAREVMERQHPELLYQIRCNMAERFNRAHPNTPTTPDAITDKSLMETMFGPKYVKWPGSEGYVYNVNRLVQLDEAGNVRFDGQRPMLTPLACVVVVEGEIDAASLEDAGFAAVGVVIREGVGYRYLFSQVRRRVIIADNDENGAGMEKAVKLAAMMGGNAFNTTILVPPAPHKDANNLVVAGEITRWLAKSGVYPTLPVRAALPGA